MNIEKIRNLGPDELLKEQRDAADQLFRLKFQLKMGQTTGVKKMRELRKDLARIKTIARQRELGISDATVGNATGGAAVTARQSSPVASAPEARGAKKAAGKKSAASKKNKKSATKKKPAAAPKKKAAGKKKKSKAKG